MEAFEGCFFRMEKRVRVINDNPMFMVADATRL